uniref:PX domain-containing protein n=2 Tax=Panagrellus redivivus TaxID=6233 RepID=A0A7E4UW98_PANRE
MINRRARIIIVALIVTIIVAYMFFDSNSVNETFYKNENISDFLKPMLNQTIKETGEGRNRTGVLFDTCVLKELDPWDADIRKHLYDAWNPLKDCKPTVEMATKLDNGKLYVLDQRDNVTCWWQCLFPKDDHSFTKGPWTKLINGSVPECDIIETSCREKHDTDLKELTPDDTEYKEKMFYEFLHAQTYRKDNPKNVTKTSIPPDVHIILFDSVSNSHFARAMPKTRHYLQHHFEGVSFPFLNKVHLNSRPNGFAFLLGKAIFDTQKSPMSVGYPDDYAGESQCHKGLDNDQFIGYQYQEAGYKTLMSEDYMLAVFTPPHCYGFNNTPVDHYMRPYQLRVDHQAYTTLKMRKGIYDGVCRDSFAPQMDYLKDMLDKYPDTPKFTISWFTYMTHENINGLFHADEYFYNWFRDNNEKLDNSYLFVMSDHGIRYGPARQTATGEREDNNPFLMMSLPASLRNNHELQSVVRHNSRQLVSHYDLYATFADIAAPNRPPNSKAPLLHGSSILKPLPQPRSCDRLRIPFEYCICDYPKTTLPEDDASGREAAAFMVESMNKIIQESKTYRNVCEHLTVSTTPVITESFDVHGNLSIYKVTFATSPGEGLFYGHITQDRNTGEFSILSRRFPRLNAYAKSAYCAEEFEYAAYCHCNEVKSTTTTTLPSPTSSTNDGGFIKKLLRF